MFSMSIQLSQYACKHRSVKTILNKAAKSKKKTVINKQAEEGVPVIK